MNVRQALIEDLDALAPLFDAYRQFYAQPSDLALARDFLLARFQDRGSVIFVAHHEGRAVGFTQLYPSFSSTRLTRIFVLNDLYVAPEGRRLGIGATLLAAARTYAESVGATRLTLATAIDNDAAQALYEREGWRRDERFYAYNLALDSV